MSLRFFFSCLVLVLALCLPAHSQNAGSTEESTPPRQQMNLTSTPEERAAYDLAAASDNGGSVGRSISAYRRFIKNNPASPLAAKAQFRIAELYESSGNTSRAFDAYQTLITQYPDTQDFEKAVFMNSAPEEQLLQQAQAYDKSLAQEGGGAVLRPSQSGRITQPGLESRN